jgi:hypothetical protein
MSKLRLILVTIFVLLLSSCGNVQEPIAVLIAEDGTKYNVMGKKNLIFKNDRMLVITYISPNLSNASLRNKEFEDLYAITANNLSPDSKYDYIALVAMEKQNKKFGINKNSGYRDRRKFSEVMLLRKGGS